MSSSHSKTDRKIATCEFCAKTFLSVNGIKRHLKYKICRGGNIPGHTNRDVKNAEMKASPPTFACQCGSQFKHKGHYVKHIEQCDLPENSVVFIDPNTTTTTTSASKLGNVLLKKTRMANYYQDNKDRLRARNKKYYQDNKERCLARAKLNNQKKREQKLEANKKSGELSDDREPENKVETTGEIFIKPERDREL